jgi:hypothetical protein
MVVIAVGKYEGGEPVWQVVCWYDNNIKIDLQEILLASVDRISVTQDMGQLRAVVYTAVNTRVPYMAWALTL